MDPAAFVLAHTTIASPPLVPEIQLHLAAEITPLWYATQEYFGERNPPPPFWGFAWSGGQALARHLLDHPELVAGRRVLDFGSGSGLVAIAARKAGAASVTAAEIDALARASLVLNAELNAAEIAVEAEDLIGSAATVWDAVLCGDMCYEHELAESLSPWLLTLARRGVEVLLGDPGRAYLPAAGLIEIGRYAVPTDSDLEGRPSQEGVVWSLR